MNCTIRKAHSPDIDALASIIRDAFEDAAWRQGITAQTNPAHPSNCRPEWLSRDMTRRVIYYVLEAGGRPAGCAGLDIVSDELCRLDKLAVLPQERRRGCGASLVRHILSEARQMKLYRVEISVTVEDHQLRDWLEKLGFEDSGQKATPHLLPQISLMTCYCL